MPGYTLLELRMHQHLFSSNILLANLQQVERSAILVGEVITIHVRVNESPLAEFRQPHFIHHMAIRVFTVLRQTGHITDRQASCLHQLIIEDGMHTAIEASRHIPGVFPQIDGIGVIRVFIGVVMRNIGGDKFRDGQGFFPCCGFWTIQRVQFEVVHYFLGTNRVPHGRKAILHAIGLEWRLLEQFDIICLKPILLYIDRILLGDLKITKEAHH